MLKWICAVLMTILILSSGAAFAEGMISAAVQVRASRSVYDSVIRTGEDVDMTVTLTGFTPTACLWYRGEALIEGENAPTMHISSAQAEDTGIYRMDALDQQGRVRVSVDVALRVVDQTLPKTGDTRIDSTVVVSLMALSALSIAFIGKKAVCKS